MISGQYCSVYRNTTYCQKVSWSLSRRHSAPKPNLYDDTDHFARCPMSGHGRLREVFGPEMAMRLRVYDFHDHSSFSGPAAKRDPASLGTCASEFNAASMMWVRVDPSAICRVISNGAESEVDWIGLGTI